MKIDIVSLLRDNHEKLFQSTRQLRECTRQEAARLLFKQFSLTLGGHLGCMNKVVYPALKSQRWKGIQSDMLVGHAKLAHALAEALTLKADGGAFSDCLVDLVDATAYVLDQEREHLLPVIENQFDIAQRLAMGLDAEPYLYTGEEADAVDSRYAASDWLEEARLILGGLQVTTPAADKEVQAEPG